jgi:hypothetical protein
MLRVWNSSIIATQSTNTQLSLCSANKVDRETLTPRAKHYEPGPWNLAPAFTTAPAVTIKPPFSTARRAP